MENFYYTRWNESVPVCVSICTCGCKKYIILSYRAFPEAHTAKRRHQIHDYDGELHLCDVNPVWKQQRKSKIINLSDNNGNKSICIIVGRYWM